MRYNLTKENLQFIADQNLWGDFEALHRKTDELGFDFNPSFGSEEINSMKTELLAIINKFDNKQDPKFNIRDGLAAVLIHQKLLDLPLKIAVVEDFWRFLGCYCYEYIFKRMEYKSNEDFKDYHFGKLRDDPISRAWWRAHLVVDESENQNEYELAKIGKSDFWRSFILRRAKYAKSKTLNRALVKYCCIPKNIEWTKNGEHYTATYAVRDLGKEIQKLHSITPYEILNEDDCICIISELASGLNLEKKLEN